MKKLAVDWWIRQRHERQIRQALNFGFADHCCNVIEEGFESNRKRNLWPTSWTSYVPAISLPSARNLARKRHGEDAIQVHECLGIASLIDATPQNLPPPKCEAWLAAAIKLLCKEVSIKNVEIFVAYCLQQLTRHRQRQASLSTRDRETFVELTLNEADLSELASALSVDVEHARLAVADLKRRLEECL